MACATSAERFGGDGGAAVLVAPPAYPVPPFPATVLIVPSGETTRIQLSYSVTRVFSSVRTSA